MYPVSTMDVCTKFYEHPLIRRLNELIDLLKQILLSMSAVNRLVKIAYKL